MADFKVQQIGGLVLPLGSALTNPLLRDADPALYFATDFFSFVLNDDFGGRLASVAASVGLGPAGGAFTFVNGAVGSTFPYDPRRYLLAGQFTSFPLLAVYRTNSQYRWRRIGWEDDRCGLGLDYILPPLSVGQAEQILPILRSAEALIRKITTQSFDPSYTPPGGAQGQSPWGLSFAAVEEIGWEKGKYGTWEGPAGELGFPGVHMDGFVVERDMMPTEAASGRVKFAGADVEEDLTADDQTSIAPLVQFSTQLAPTITSVSPAAGSINGGTSVTLTGTLFLNGALVFFGNLDQAHRATGVVVNSPTSITCTSPAVSGPGVLPITVVNVDGQQGALKSAFTYS